MDEEEKKAIESVKQIEEYKLLKLAYGIKEKKKTINEQELNKRLKELVGIVAVFIHSEIDELPLDPFTKMAAINQTIENLDHACLSANKEIGIKRRSKQK